MKSGSRYSCVMLTIRDHHSGDLFDPWEFLGERRKRLLTRSWAGVFRDFLLKHLPVGELAKKFHDDFGRPTKDLYVALGALILQQLHDFTDRQTAEAVALNISWHSALDIRRDSAGVRKSWARAGARPVSRSDIRRTSN